MDWLNTPYIENKEHLGLALKALRKSKKVKQKKLARQLGMDVKTLRKIEQGQEDYSIDKLFAILSFFKKRLSSFHTMDITDTLSILDEIERELG